MQLVFGGAGMHGTLGDLWMFNTKTGTWVTPMAEGQAPCPREMHSGNMLTDCRMLICGGRSAAGQVPSKFYSRNNVKSKASSTARVIACMQSENQVVQMYCM